MTRRVLAMMLVAGWLLAPGVVHAQTPAQTPGQAAPQTAAPTAAQTVVSPAFEQDIKRLLEVTNAQRMSEQISTVFMAQFSQALKASNPNIPPRAMEIATEVARSFFVQRYPQLVPKMVAAYAKVLTPDDVRQLLAFYETPLGKRLLDVAPSLSQAGSAAGQEWGQAMIPDLTAELQRRFKAEGLIP